MGLQVIGAGFGRTGTLSLKVALEQIGFGPCHHMHEVMSNKDDVPFFTEAASLLNGNPDKAVDWDAIYSRYNAAVDFPNSCFYKQLVEKYPDAKVVLTVREPEKWYDSAANTIYRYRQADQVSTPGMQQMVEQVVWRGIFKGKFEDKEAAIKIFNDNIEEVKRYVPADRLLVFSVKDGWKPLCQFLGVPIPDTPFPRVNERASMPTFEK